MRSIATSLIIFGLVYAHTLDSLLPLFHFITLIMAKKGYFTLPITFPFGSLVHSMQLVHMQYKSTVFVSFRHFLGYFFTSYQTQIFVSLRWRFGLAQSLDESVEDSRSFFCLFLTRRHHFSSLVVVTCVNLLLWGSGGCFWCRARWSGRTSGCVCGLCALLVCGRPSF